MAYYDGATLLGTDSTLPYSITPSLSGGPHYLKVIATDANGLSRTSFTNRVDVAYPPVANPSTFSTPQAAPIDIDLRTLINDGETPLTSVIVRTGSEALPHKASNHHAQKGAPAHHQRELVRNQKEDQGPKVIVDHVPIVARNHHVPKGNRLIPKARGPRPDGDRGGRRSRGRGRGNRGDRPKGGPGAPPPNPPAA